MPTNVPPKYQINLGADSSRETGNPWFVGDYTRLTVSISPAVASSIVTIVGSNLDGFTSGLSTALRTGSNNTWSIVTSITGSGLIATIDPGFRWINAIRATSASGQTASNITVIFTGAY